MNPYRELILQIINERRETIAKVGGPYESYADVEKWQKLLEELDSRLGVQKH